MPICQLDNSEALLLFASTSKYCQILLVDCVDCAVVPDMKLLYALYDLATLSVLLVLVARENCPSTAACVAVKLTSPVPTMVIKVPDASIVATPVLLLLYVIAPLLLLAGNVVALNAASPYVFVSGTENVLAKSVGVALKETVSVLLVLVAPENCPATAACVATNATFPTPYIVIVVPEASMPAIPVWVGPAT